ncbi:MAG TPA: IPT/TIG domain-containing protein [Acidimicrobiales bacterium]|nr:IPT/TIG domain-containing protein [Acidimicrobiales bacterium]
MRRLVVGLVMGLVTAVPIGVVGVTVPAGGTAVRAGAHPVTFPERIRAGHPGARVHPAGRSQFPGLGPCDTVGFCYTPGEPTVAAGPTDILETANTQLAVYNKATGAQLAVYPLETFWPGTSSADCVDVRGIYLPGDNRFAVSCVDISAAQTMRFAVSQSGDPTAGWYKYSVGPADDQPKIEATSDKLIVAGNTSTTEDIYVYNKSDVLAGMASPPVVHLSAVQSNVYESVVEQTYTSAAYMIDTFQCTGCTEWLATITGSPAAHNVALTETSLGATSDAAPHEPTVPGGNLGGGDLDGRTYAAVYETETSDAKPVIQYSTADTCGSWDCVVSGRVDLSGSSPVRLYESSIGQSGFDYTYGAVGLDAAGDVFMTYTRSSPAMPASAAVLGPGFDLVFQPGTPGTTPCASGQTPPCDERWGDYLATSIDPSDPSSVWVSGLYQNQSGGFSWGSAIAKVNLATTTLPTVTSVSPPNGPSGGATTVTVDGSGFEHAGVPDVSEVSFTPIGGGPILSATNVTVTSNTQLTAVTPDASSITGSGDAVTDVQVTADGLESLTGAGDEFTFDVPTPVITAVAFKGKPTSPTITVTGSGFLPEPASDGPPCGQKHASAGADYANNLYLNDTTAGFGAGQDGDCVGLVVKSYSGTQVVLKLGSFYKKGHYSAFAAGDAITFDLKGTQFSGTVAYKK